MSNQPDPQEVMTVGNAIGTIFATNTGVRRTAILFSVWDDEWEARYVFHEDIHPNALQHLQAAMNMNGPLLHFSSIDLGADVLSSQVQLKQPMRVDELVLTTKSYAKLRRTDRGKIMRLDITLLTRNQFWLPIPLFLKPGKVKDIPDSMEQGRVTFGRVFRRM